MNLTNIIWRQRSQNQKSMNCVITFLQNTNASKNKCMVLEVNSGQFLPLGGNSEREEADRRCLGCE
jgi:hypothetical protein